jgi:putative ABC transport system permease protein
MPMKNAYYVGLENCNLEQFRILPVMDFTDNEFADIIMEYNINPQDADDLNIQALVDKYKIDLIPYYQERISELEKSYNFTSEVYERKYIKDGKVVFYITSEPKTINKYTITEGNSELRNNNILVSAQYANSNDLHAGEDIEINGKIYRISGLYYQPAESLVFNSQYSSEMGNRNNAGIILSDENFKELNYKGDIVFLAKFNDTVSNENISEQTRILMSDDAVSYLVKSSDLGNYKTLTSNFDTSLSLMVLGLLLFFITIIILIFQILKNQFEQTAKSIGILKAMGYPDFTISLSFFVFMVPVTIGLLMGLIIGFFASSGFMLTYLNIFNFVPAKISFDYFLSVCVVFAISFITAAISIFNGYMMVRKNPLDLIHERKDNRAKLLTIITGKIASRFKFVQKTEFCFLTANISRVIAISLMSIISFILLNFAVSIFGLTQSPVMELSKASNYKFVTIYNEVQKTDNQSNNVAYSSPLYLLSCSNRKIEHTYQCMFIDDTFNSMKILDDSGNSIFSKISEKSSVIISQKLAYDYDIKIGDMIDIKATGENDFSAIVTAVNPLSYDSNLYLNIKAISDVIKKASETQYNIEYLEERPQDVDENIVTIQSKDERINQISKMLDGSLNMIPILVLITLILIISISGLLAYLNTNDNRKNISIFSIMGYKNSTILKMVVNIYSWIIFFGSTIGFALLKTVFSQLELFINNSTDVYITLEMYWEVMLLSIVFLYLIYRASIFICYRRLINIDVSKISYE